MAGIKISPFGGLLPKIGSRLLPPSAATKANNLKLQSGELRPLRKPFLTNFPNKPQPAVSVFLARNSTNQSAWFSWPIDVDVVRAPFNIDVESRFYWTGDGAPKFATYSKSVTGGLNNYPSSAFDLGIPTPQTKPTVSHAGGTGLATTRFYCYTYFSELGEESAPSPVSDIFTGKFDGTWTISNMNEIPINTSGGTATYAAGTLLTTFNTTGAVRHWLRVGDSVVLNSVTLKVISVLSASSFTVTGDFSTATVWARLNNWNTNNMKRRIYRTAGTIAQFQLVANDVPTTYNDILLDSAILGDSLISQGWFPPPVGLRGVTVHSSGSLMGFINNILCGSVPYQPHAWRDVDRNATDFKIVGIAAYGSEIGIGTEGTPYIASGVEVESMTLQKIDDIYPCLSKRSMASIGNGFIYSTKHGFAMINASGVSLITDKFFTIDEWLEYNPSSIITSLAYGRIYIAYTRADGGKAMLIIDNDLLITADIVTFELYTDKATGELYITDSEGIKAWDSIQSYPLTNNWKSKDFVLTQPVNLGAAKIDFDLAISAEDLAFLQAINAAITATNIAILSTGNAKGSINAKAYNKIVVNGSAIKQAVSLPSNVVTFILRKHDNIVTSRTVTNTKAFRLPAGYKDDVFSIEVLSQCRIREIRVAETKDGLRTL